MDNVAISDVYQLKARDIVNCSPDFLRSNLFGEIDLEFEDVVVKTNHKEILYSSYFWRYHREYQDLPLLSRHFVQKHLDGGIYTSGTHGAIISAILEDIAVIILGDQAIPRNIEPLLIIAYEIINDLYNDMITHITEYTVNIDIIDFIEIMNKASIKEAIEKLDNEASNKNVLNIYEVIKKVVSTDTSLAENQLVRAIRSGSVNMNQVLQCIGSRGYVTELDSKNFDIPVSRGFAKGMGNIYNLAAESRSGAKALFFSDSAIKDSEYFARRLQLLTLTLEKIVYTDCGSEDYLLWNVRPRVLDEGTETYRGDLPFLEGKYYLDEETGSLKIIKKDSVDIIGKTIKIRSSIHCKLPDKHSVCSTCFGDLSKNISEHSNIGHLIAVILTLQITQSLLSTKHIDFNSVINKIALTKTDMKYLRTTRDGTSYIIKKEVPRKGLKLIISQSEALGIADIYVTDNINKINPNRASMVENITLVVQDRIGELRIPIEIQRDSRKGMFSHVFMQHIKDTGYETDDRGNLIFDMSEWKNHPFLVLPQMENNFSAHGSEIARLLEQTVNTLGDKDGNLTPDNVLTRLFDLVNSKLFVNLSILDTMVYAISAADPVGGDYGLSRGHLDPKVYSGNKLIANRSLSSLYAFENIIAKIIEPGSYDKGNRPDHMFDCMVAPAAVLKDKQH